MSKSTKGLKRVIRGLSRAFTAKDERAIDQALGELEDIAEDAGEEDPETVEIHNHIPDSMRDMSRDTSLGELPERGAADGEAPPWFKKHQEDTARDMKSMRDSIEELKGGGDRRNRDRRDGFEDEEILEGEDGSAEEENLEIADGRRRSRDEPSEREDMGERIRENERTGGPKDEANREILGELEHEAPPGTGDKARRAKDSAFLEDSFQEVVSRAEVIAPGTRLPTYDAKAEPVATLRAIDRLRRSTLDLAYGQAETRGLIDAALSGRTFDSKKMSISNARVLFNVVADRVGSSNNQRATDRSTFTTPRDSQAAGVQTLKQLNARNEEFYSKKRA